MSFVAQRDSRNVHSGLASTQVEESRRLHGMNVLTPPPREPEWKKFLAKFDDATIKILLFCAVLTLGVAAVEYFVLGGTEFKWVDTLGIFFAVGVATTVAYLNERKSEREFELLNSQKEAIDAEVIRDGNVHMVPIADLVVGDLVHAKMGFKVYADGEVVSCHNLQVDESLMTGESVPAAKTSEVLPAGDAQSAFPSNRVFRGTMVVEGHGWYVVTAVGDGTELGKLSKELGDEDDSSPLKEKLTTLADQIGMVGTIAAIAIFAVMAGGALVSSQLMAVLLQEAGPGFVWGVFGGCLLGGPRLSGWLFSRLFGGLQDSLQKSKWRLPVLVLFSLPLALACYLVIFLTIGAFIDTGAAIGLLESILLSFVVAVTIVVVAVPEGLPMMVNVSLALNMRKMAKQNCLVRKLVASETIGSATIICTDKTGTLTQNRMRPVWFYLGGRTFTDDPVPQAPNAPEWDHLVRNIALNSVADLEHHSSGVRGVGNPTESSLLLRLHEQGIDYRKLREEQASEWQVDFTSDRKMSIAKLDALGGHTCYAKGAPERVLANCTHFLIGAQTIPMTAEHRAAINAALVDASGRALRVIGFSEKLPGVHQCTAEARKSCLSCGERAFVGLVGIKDPLRDGVRVALNSCRAAGVEVKMLTGDDLGTARSIARDSGIMESDTDLVLTSNEFQKLTDADLAHVAPKLRVLARSSPMDKLRLVRALRTDSSVVAVTGDGINDTPALKAADVGLAMGSGHEVAKEASDIVLVDDNFASIVTGISWGRTLYENIQRFLQFQLSVNVVALACALIGPLVGVPLPFTVPQLLWINIIMDTFAALALSTDPPRSRYMKQSPVPRGAHIITPAMAVTIGINSIYQVGVLLTLLLTDFLGGDSVLQKQAIFFTVFVMFQFWHKFNCRSLRHNESPFERILQSRNFLVIVGAITVVQVVMVQLSDVVPIVGEVFRTVPLTLDKWLWILLVTSTVLPVAWFARQVAYWVGAEQSKPLVSEQRPAV